MDKIYPILNCLAPTDLWKILHSPCGKEKALGDQKRDEDGLLTEDPMTGEKAEEDIRSKGEFDTAIRK
jgi:hypothetical protein